MLKARLLAAVGVPVATLFLVGGSALGAEPRRHVTGARDCGTYFRDTLLVIPAGQYFTLTGLGVDFRRGRRGLTDSMYVALWISNARLQIQGGIRFRRGLRAGPMESTFERPSTTVTYAPGDTLVATLHNIDEEYWKLEGWPKHTIRWEGFYSDTGSVTGWQRKP